MTGPEGWPDLHAYLEILGEHPALSAVGGRLIAMRSSVTVYENVDRPDVEVDVDGVWLPGEARMRWQDDEGVWWANVSWRAAGQHSRRRLDNFPVS